MINIEQLKKQHAAIEEELKSILDLTMEENFSERLSDITLHINKLAGQLNIHLMSEDDFMYPALKASKEPEVREMAGAYSQEMGDLVVDFQNYKVKFNTRNKVLAAQEEFRPATKVILKRIQTRIDKENRNLYRLIAEKQI